MSSKRSVRDARTLIPGSRERKRNSTGTTLISSETNSFQSLAQQPKNLEEIKQKLFESKKEAIRSLLPFSRDFKLASKCFADLSCFDHQNLLVNLFERKKQMRAQNEQEPSVVFKIDFSNRESILLALRFFAARFPTEQYNCQEFTEFLDRLLYGRLKITNDPIFVQSLLLSQPTPSSRISIELLNQYAKDLSSESRVDSEPMDWQKTIENEEKSVAHHNHGEAVDDFDFICSFCGKGFVNDAENEEQGTLLKAENIISKHKNSTIATKELLVFLFQLSELSVRIEEIKKVFAQIVKRMPVKNHTVEELTLNLLQKLDGEEGEYFLARQAIEKCSIWSFERILNIPILKSSLSVFIETYFTVKSRAQDLSTHFIFSSKLGIENAEPQEEEEEEEAMSESEQACMDCKVEELYVIACDQNIGEIYLL